MLGGDFGEREGGREGVREEREGEGGKERGGEGEGEEGRRACDITPPPLSFLPPPLLGVNMEPHRRQLHVTLAHQYLPEHHSALGDLARTMIDPQAPSRWEIQLYSRDYRLAASEVSPISHLVVGDCLW